MLFAESMPTAPTSSIGLAVVVGGILISSVSAVLTMFLTRREHVEHKKEVDRRLTAIESQFTSLQAKIDETGDEIAEAERRISAAGEHRAEALHVRFNDVLKNLSELRGEMNANQRKP